MSREVIYRIQDKDGRGPWRPGFSRRWVETRPDHDNLPPWIVEFGPVHLQVLYGCACGSGCMNLDQLRRWFTESEYRTLLKFGYRAVRMEVGRVLAKSDIQCLFERAKPLSEDVIEVDLYPVPERQEPMRVLSPVGR